MLLKNANNIKLGISNIGWEPQSDRIVAEILSRNFVRYIDVAPTKYFDWLDKKSLIKSEKVKNFWLSHNVSIRGMQSLLYGRPDLNILRTSDKRALQDHFKRVFDIASAMGANRIVFGSPQNRIKGEISMREANSRAAEFFKSILDFLPDGAVMMLEPNPTIYGCDYLTTTESALDLVRKIDSPNIRTQLDLGTCLINNEAPTGFLANSEEYFGYVHLATDKLVPLYQSPNPLIPDFLNFYNGSLECSIEQRVNGGSAEDEIQKTLDWIHRCLVG